VELASIDFSAFGLSGGSCMSLWLEKSEGRTYRYPGKTRLSTELSGLSPQEDPNASF
jgi:hypothetical protein